MQVSHHLNTIEIPEKATVKFIIKVRQEIQEILAVARLKN
jgi:hypothetical protein